MKKASINKLRFDYDYYRHPKKGWPKIVNWGIVAGPPGAKLSPLQQYDVVFDEYDLQIRKLI